jgi:hypothetical protein
MIPYCIFLSFLIAGYVVILHFMMLNIRYNPVAVVVVQCLSVVF